MFIYYSSVLICFIATFFKDKKIKLFILVGLMIFLCAGYMCGTDWRSYEFAYNHSSLSTVNQEIFEIGYSYLQAICHTLGINFWIFHIALKSIVFFSLCYFVKVFKQNLFLFWFLFLPDMGFYLFIDCPFRNLLAAGGFFLAINLFLKRKFIIFFFITILLAQVHSSAYFLIIIYLFSNLRAKNRYIILFFILSNILAYRLDLITDYILFPLLGIDGYLGERVRTYFRFFSV
ncbi:EpsG family protein [Bacteroides eggerthii]|nr:EpsG family protein [Bacteroides eggerthii]